MAESTATCLLVHVTFVGLWLAHRTIEVVVFLHCTQIQRRSDNGRPHLWPAVGAPKGAPGWAALES